MPMKSFLVYLQFKCEYITLIIKFTAVTLQERSKCYMREEIRFNVKLIKL